MSDCRSISFFFFVWITTDCWRHPDIRFHYEQLAPSHISSLRTRQQKRATLSRQELKEHWSESLPTSAPHLASSIDVTFLQMVYFLAVPCYSLHLKTCCDAFTAQIVFCFLAFLPVLVCDFGVELGYSLIPFRQEMPVGISSAHSAESTHVLRHSSISSTSNTVPASQQVSVQQPSGAMHSLSSSSDRERYIPLL